MPSALVTKLRKDPGVRDAEALAGWLGRRKSQKKAGFGEPTSDDRKRLGIPPAWKDVRVADDKNSALQAIGTDKKGREQRIYSAEHHEKQAAEKFARVKELHNRLPAIDSRLSKDAKDDDSALGALLIRRMGLRPGSDADTGADKKAFGATNLQAKHVEVDGDTINANFTGKKGVELNLQLNDPELAGLLKDRKGDKSGDDRLLDTNDRKLRGYMKDAAPGVKPKDFRTYLGTATAADMVSSMPVPKTEKEYKAARKEVGKRVSELLGNTPTVALSSYIAPSVFGKWDAKIGN